MNWNKTIQEEAVPNGKATVLFSNLVISKTAFDKVRDENWYDFADICVKGYSNLKSDWYANYQLVKPESFDGTNPLEKSTIQKILLDEVLRSGHGGTLVLAMVDDDNNVRWRTYIFSAHETYPRKAVLLVYEEQGNSDECELVLAKEVKEKLPKTKAQAKPKVKKVLKKVEMEFDDPETGDFRKWWNIEQTANEVTRTWGAAGQVGETKTQTFSSVSEATAFVTKMVKQKNSHGYVVALETGKSILG